MVSCPYNIDAKCILERKGSCDKTSKSHIKYCVKRHLAETLTNMISHYLESIKENNILRNNMEMNKIHEEERK